MSNYVMQVILAMISTIGFSIIFNVPKKELAFCGVTGLAVWTMYLLTVNAGYIWATLSAAALATVLARIFSIVRKMPVTIFLIPGIIPLVPGAGIYYTMFYIIFMDNEQAIGHGLMTIARAGTISLGLLIILSLPAALFRWAARLQKF